MPRLLVITRTFVHEQEIPDGLDVTTFEEAAYTAPITDAVMWNEIDPELEVRHLDPLACRQGRHEPEMVGDFTQTCKHCGERILLPGQ